MMHVGTYKRAFAIKVLVVVRLEKSYFESLKYTAGVPLLVKKSVLIDAFINGAMKSFSTYWLPDIFTSGAKTCTLLSQNLRNQLDYQSYFCHNIFGLGRTGDRACTVEAAVKGKWLHPIAFNTGNSQGCIFLRFLQNVCDVLEMMVETWPTL